MKASVWNPNWKYVPACSTNILETFRRLGWIPPSELKHARNH